ncbi:MAG: EAL domain-containing protein [Xanthomonadales bacterium]|nr:EAL domain-containing protein [Xanthomonadales bacterium]
MTEFNGRILVADDDQRAAASVEALITLQGYEVSVVNNGEDAVAELKRRRYDVLLLDLMMPRMTGIEVMDFIQQSELDVTVIVMSGDTSIENVIHSLRHGAYDYLRKPYAPEVLTLTVENAIRKCHLIQENQRIQGKLAHSERLYRYMVNSSPDIIYMLDSKGRFTFINTRIASLLGYEPKELIGQHFSTLVYPEDLDKATHIFNERRTGERATRNVELRLRCKDSSASPRIFDNNTLPIELSSMGMYVVEDPQGSRRYMGTYGVARDITERKRAEEVIRYQAFHDLLTGLPNRALFKDRLHLSISQARRSKHGLAVMFIDLDRFKLVNDTLGHVRGDELLQMVATRLRGSMREGDTIARVGGDEFIILIPQINSHDDAAHAAQKIIEELSQPFMLENHEVFVSTSIGIAAFPEHGADMDTLIKNADIAMYHIKENGRDGYEFFDDEMKARVSHLLSLESGLRKAVENDQLELLYQPQFDIRNNRIVGVEALVRWNHPEQGLMSPVDFVPHAEECGLIMAVGDWVLRQALSDMRAWREQGLPEFTLCVNLSAMQLAHEQVDRFVSMLDEFQIPGSALELEITENVIMRDLDSVANKLNLLSRHGVKIAIDDFGTGYSSMGYLQKLPINTIKIDRSFVWDIRPETNGASIVNAIVAMAKGLGLNIIAEGVETQAQMNHLAALECNVVQGFLLSKPLTADALVKLLKAAEGEDIQSAG